MYNLTDADGLLDLVTLLDADSTSDFVYMACCYEVTRMEMIELARIWAAL